MKDYPATQPQLDFIETLRQRLHLSEQLLDNHCHRVFGAGVEDLDKRQASTLLDEMNGWTELGKSLPPVLQREAGQVDLPGVPS